MIIFESNDDDDNDEDICDFFTCAFIMAIVQIICQGSYVAPMKEVKTKNSKKFDVLFFQTCRVFVCFTCSWFLLLLRTVSLKFTWWGIFSGFITVPNGVFCILSVRYTGITTAVSVRTIISIFVSDMEILLYF